MKDSLHIEPIKIPLLMFSGGLDSTYNLWDRLQRTPVDTLYADGGQAPLKIEAEKAARTAIVEEIHKNSTFKVRRDIIADPIKFVDAPGFRGFTQVPAWLFTALYHVDPDIHSSVEIAYVMGDDALVFRHEIIQAWEALCKLTKGGVVPLVFPTMMFRKPQLVNYLSFAIREKIWVCEIPMQEKKKIIACGHCAACVRSKNETPQEEKIRLIEPPRKEKKRGKRK